MPQSSPAATGRGTLLLFGLLVVSILVVDQLVKAWILASFRFEVPVGIVGDYVRITLIHNSGALFGLFPDAAPLFAALSLAVMGSIVWFEVRYGRSSWLMTVALGLLLGGALGNLFDRLRFNYVLDFVDMGLGGWRWYTYNVADSAISAAIVLLLLVALFPALDRPAHR